MFDRAMDEGTIQPMQPLMIPTMPTTHTPLSPPGAQDIEGGPMSVDEAAALMRLGQDGDPLIRRGSSTYCNVAACRLTRLVFGARVLPRIWWTDEAVDEWLRTGSWPAVKYGVTATEVSANRMTDWLTRWGPEFGWTIETAADLGGVAALTERAETLIQAGRFVLVCWASTRGSGHVAVVRHGGQDLSVTQAGLTNGHTTLGPRTLSRSTVRGLLLAHR